MMIKVSERCYVASEDVSEVTMSEHGHITVRLKNGIGYSLEKQYGEADYKAMDRIIAAINAGRKEPL